MQVTTIHATENAKMIAYPTGGFKVVYMHFFGDDMYGMEFDNMAEAGEMFNMINMADIEAEELQDLGFTI